MLMAHAVILHINGEPSVLGEVEEIPKLTDTIIIISNPRLRDGKDIHYLELKVIWPMSQVALIEILESDEEESLIGFVRE